MPEIVVTAQARTEVGKNVNRRLRVQGLIPGVVYGAKREPLKVSVSPKAIAGILRSKSGENTLFDLELDGGRRKVIVKDYQLEPLQGRLLHADFYEVALDKAIHVRVHVELLGTPVGVKTQGGILDFVTRELEVSCLPTDIPEKIEVDISELEMGKSIRVEDLKALDKVKMLTEPDLVIAHVVAARAETTEAAAAPAEGAAAGEPEVIKKGKEEGGDEKKAAAAGGDKKAAPAAEKKPAAKK